MAHKLYLVTVTTRDGEPRAVWERFGSNKRHCESHTLAAAKREWPTDDLVVRARPGIHRG